MHTYIYRTNIKRECVTGIVGHISHVIAPVKDSCYPMRNSRPDADPYHERWVKRNIMKLDDVVDRVVEQGDQTSDPNDRDRLSGEKAEYHGRQC
jgi:hypothetical protein